MAIKKEFKLGIFVVVILVATFAIINVLRGTDILGREMELQGKFQDVETLVASAPVMIRGYNAGRVSEVRYDSVDDCFIVTCSISKEFQIPSDSRMMLFSTSIMGGKGVKIVSGTSETLAADGDTLETGSEADMLSSISSEMGPLVAKVNYLLDSLSTTVSSVNEVVGVQNRGKISKTLSHLEATMAQARKLAETLPGKSEQLDQVLANLDLISEKVVPIVDSLNSTVSDVNTITGKLADVEIAATVDKVNGSLDSVNSTLSKIQDPLESVLIDADSLINAISKNPKKYIKITIF